MSQWYEHQQAHENHLWLYSERGLMSYLFCQLLADHLDFVLDNAQDVDGTKQKSRRPMHLCRVCLRKLCWNLRTEPVPYLAKMKVFVAHERPRP